MKTAVKDRSPQPSHSAAMDEGLVRAFTTIAKVLSQSPSLEMILTTTLDLILPDPRLDAGEIYLLDEKSGKLSYAYHRGLSQECVDEAKKVSIKLGQGLTGYVAATKEPIMVLELSQEPRFLREVPKKEGYRALISLPIKSGDRVYGVVNLFSRDGHQLSLRYLGWLAASMEMVGIAFDYIRLFEAHNAKVKELEKAYEGLKLAHNYIVQWERIRALGEMASGVAHEFNNILSIILGRAQLALEDARDPGVVKALQIIEETALDAAQTVRRLQDFARVRLDCDFETVNLNRVVERALQMVEPRRMKHQETGAVAIDICTELGEVAPVEGNPAELEEALVNILFNAIDAMPQGGKICVKSEQKNGWAILSISDTGVGMTDEIKSKIFDPFFTTKGQHGLGMGLSVTYSIIARHRGIIDVDSTPGAGTTFYIKLPVATSHKKDGDTGSIAPSAAGASILVVDDDPRVSQILELMLAQMGYNVTGVTSGREAISAFEKGDYKLVITDLGMPDMSGREVARAIKERQPKTPVILITGWGVQLDPEEMKKVGIDGIIPKPLSRRALSVQIAELLPTKP